MDGSSRFCFLCFFVLLDLFEPEGLAFGVAKRVAFEEKNAALWLSSTMKGKTLGSVLHLSVYCEKLEE